MLCVAAVALLVVGLASVSEGAVAFSVPAALSASGESAIQPAVSVGPDGTAVAVWSRPDGGSQLIQQATKRPGESAFGAPETISAVGRNAQYPVASVGADGIVTVAWIDYYSSNQDVVVATRGVGASTFGTPQTVSEINLRNYAPSLATSATGETTVLWSRPANSSTNMVITSATRPANSTTVGAFTDVGIPAGPYQLVPEGAYGIDGSLTVVWSTVAGVWASTRSAGSSSFETPVSVAALSGGLNGLMLAVGPNGLAVAVWVPVGNPTSIYSATRPDGSSSFGSAVDMTPGEFGEGEPDVAIAQDGTATVSYFSATVQNGPSLIRTMTRQPGSTTFDAAVPISTLSAWNPNMAIAPDGAVTIAWDTEDGNGQGLIEVSTRSAGSEAFSAPTTVSDSSRYSSENALAIGGDGSTVVLFKASNGFNRVIWATFQAGTPSIGEVSPATGSVDGGTSLTITGFNFTAGATVDIGSVACVNLVIVDFQTMTCDSPAQGAGVLDVTVETADSQRATAIGAFEYVAPVAPTTTTTAVPTPSTQPSPTTTMPEPVVPETDDAPVSPAFTG